MPAPVELENTGMMRGDSKRLVPNNDGETENEGAKVAYAGGERNDTRRGGKGSRGGLGTIVLG